MSTRLLTAALCALASSAALHAQQASPYSAESSCAAASPSEETVTLSPFEVSSYQPARY
ncbi:hypothetical protein [Cephaloticoccus primus]|nr:hypothetical protein [Cephaloticoccus primus]